MLLRAFIILLGLLPSAALADIRAVYSGGFGTGYMVEIADNGDMRADLESGLVLIVRGDVAYTIDQRLTGPIVTRGEDMIAVWRAQAPAPGPAPTGQFAIVPQGTKIVNGRTGTAFFIRNAIGGLSERPLLVMSDDPDLRPIGRAMARMTAMDMEKQAASAQEISREGALIAAAMKPIMEKGAPLQLGDLKLVSVESVAIPAERFALPGEPETRDALRARLAAETKAETDAEKKPPARTADISQAIFSQGRLWLLNDGGELSSLSESDDALRHEQPGGYVLGLCARSGEPVALTAEDRMGRSWTIHRRHEGEWQTGPTVSGRHEALVAFACEAEGEMLLSRKRLVSFRSGVMNEVKLSGDLQPALVRSSIFATPAYVFVGLNAGEWGGGLRRIDRKSGRIAKLERNVTGQLCDGPLNTDCDPVQGIAAIPWKPECMAAAIGLIHMTAHGRIVDICGERIEPLYAKASLGASPEQQAAVQAGQNGDSVAFFGLVRLGDTLLAAGHDGLYRFNGPGAPSFQPLPRFKRVGGVLVSFALPDAALVITGINQRASVSGGAPIIVPR